MPIHGYPGGVITANPTAPTSSVATGVWTTEQQLQAKSAGNWPFTIPTQQISRSLRFNPADTTYLNRTFSTPTNNKIWTWSSWVKKSALGGSGQELLFVFPDGSNYAYIQFTSGDALELGGQTGGVSFSRITSAVFRDLSAWYAINVIVDTTLATANDRIKIYVNNVLQTLTGTAPTQNSNLVINTAVAHQIGRHSTSGNYYFGGYLAEINFIDGQALTPSSFGQTNASTGVWEPINYTGTYGTNGFYLNFSDNSGTTSTTLGKDSSGNGNNWTPNNFSVTAGVGNDSLVDSPTAYGTDTGVGGEVRGNYATFNALTTTGNTLTNGNLDAAAAAAAWRGSFSTIGVSSGKWYMEFTIVGGTFARQIIGIALNSAVNSASFYGYGFVSGSQFMGRSVGAIPVDYSSGTLTSLSPTTDFDNGDVVGLCIDADAGKLWVFKNNTIIEGTVNGTANVTWTANSLVFPVASMYSGDSVYANFGQRAFAYTAPSGFKALCTQNLPTPTIGATSTTQANDYMNVVLYTGTGSSLGVTGVGFQPDFVWIKGRSGATDHGLYDAVRGVQKQLESNTTTVETTETTGLTAFGTDGFTVGALAQLNTSSATYVAWNWKANGAGVSNTAGTITSTVSANTTSGFSIVTYTGTGANATVGHGIGTAPSMIFVKGRSGSGSGNSWRVYHSGANASPASGALYLNSTSAFTTDATAWNSTAPTSNVFSLGTDAGVNSTGTYVAYCFAPVAGYSAFGSYTGNGSTDGPFIFTNFRPRFVIRKCSGATGNWFINDAARDSSNVVLLRLNADLSDAESSGANSDIDFLSNGFKIRATSTAGVNQSGQTHIYMAFAENPFKYSLAR